MKSSRKIPSIEEATVDSVQKYINADFKIELKIHKKVTRNFSSMVFQAELNGKIVFIKISSDLNVFPVEIAGYKLFNDIGIPTPNVLFYQSNPKNIGFPTIILSAANGQTLNDSMISKNKKLLIYKKIGEYLSKIHKVKVRGWGRLVLRDNELVGRSSNRQDFHGLKNQKAYSERLNYLMEHRLIEVDDFMLLVNSNKELESIELDQASILHLDMHGGHVFQENGNICEIIDLGQLTAGDPRYDIAMSLMFQDKEEQVAFKSGYGESAFDRDVLKYLLFISASKLVWLHKNNLIRGVERVKKIFQNTSRILREVDNKSLLQQEH